MRREKAPAKKSQPVAAPVMGFTVEVDGRKFGPFPEKRRSRFRYLENRKGVVIKPVRLDSASLSLSLSPPKKKGKQEHPSLLEGIDFMPVSKPRR